MSISETELSRPEYADELEKAAAVLVHVGTELPGLFRDCRRAWVETRPDGYPTSSRAEGSGPTNVTHEFVEPDGSTILLSVPQHSDPVGEAACAPLEANPAASAHRQARVLVLSAEKQVAQAHALLYKACNPPPAVVEDEQLDENDWCSVCIRVTRTDGMGRKTKVMNPTYSIEAIHPGEVARARCSGCAGWAHDAQHEPGYPNERPARLIVLEAEGRPLTTRDVEAAVGGKP